MEKPDFIGINVYNGECVDTEGKAAGRWPGFPLTATKWPVTPEVMHYAPLNLSRRYGLPMMITENGQSCNDRIFRDGQVHDPERIDFLHRYLLELHKAVEEGAPLEGYLQWSFLDNFEWSDGYGERFGIVYVDYPTQRRIPKDSAFWFGRVIESNGAPGRWKSPVPPSGASRRRYPGRSITTCCVPGKSPIPSTGTMRTRR